jgi:hypothetical protein
VVGESKHVGVGGLDARFVWVEQLLDARDGQDVAERVVIRAVHRGLLRVALHELVREVALSGSRDLRGLALELLENLPWVDESPRLHELVEPGVDLGLLRLRDLEPLGPPDLEDRAGVDDPDLRSPRTLARHGA